MRYLVSLTPLEPYFFGSEITFGERGSKEHGSYIAKSSYFPQQSTFLGALRKAILDRVQEYSKAKALIGGSKFFIKSKDSQALNFGAIRSISNLFIANRDELFLPLRDIFSFKIKKDEEYFVQNYSAKDGIALKLFSLDFQKELPLSDVFEEKEMVGNSKREKEDAFFKKVVIKMQKGYSFAYLVDFDEDLMILDKQIIFFGGERSKFFVEVKKDFFLADYSSKLQERLNQVTDEEYIYLINDSYINLNIKKHSSFAINHEIAFAYIDKLKKSSHLKSKQFFFYERGGIFINPDEQLKKALNQEYLQQIGYNKFIIKDEK